MSTDISMKNDELVHVPGVSEEAAKKLVGFFNTYNALARASVKTIMKFGVDEDTAQFLKELAETKLPPPVADASGEKNTEKIEEAQDVFKGKAPAGTTAVKKLLRRSNSLARQLGLPAERYTGCSHCRNDLDVASEDHGIELHDMSTCPYCDAIFVVESKVHCYCCSTSMTDDGRCLKCGAKRNDDEALKAMTIHLRKEQGVSGRSARATAQGFLLDAGFKAQVLAQAKAEKWIDKAEEGTMFPFANGGRRNDSPIPSAVGQSSPRQFTGGVKLSHDTITSLHSAIVSARMVDIRNTLLCGIDPGFVAMMPHVSSPGAQILKDLHTLNDTPMLNDNSDPMMTWLKNAVSQAGVRREATTFSEAIKLRAG